MKIETGRGHKRNLNNTISISTGRYGASNISQLHKKKLKKNKKNNIQLCSKCSQKIGKGLSHKCLSVKTKVSEIIKIIPESIQEQVVSRIVRNKLGDDSANRHIKDKEVDKEVPRYQK